MDKTNFKPDHQYTVAMKDEHGRVKPANLYVYRVYENFMVARMTQDDGLLRRIEYGDVERVVSEKRADPDHLRATPQALLEEKFWAGRKVMQHYASAPGLGK